MDEHYSMSFWDIVSYCVLLLIVVFSDSIRLQILGSVLMGVIIVKEYIEHNSLREQEEIYRAFKRIVNKSMNKNEKRK